MLSELALIFNVVTKSSQDTYVYVRGIKEGKIWYAIWPEAAYSLYRSLAGKQAKENNNNMLISYL